jgi:hypothetical protein
MSLSQERSWCENYKLEGREKASSINDSGSRILPEVPNASANDGAPSPFGHIQRDIPGAEKDTEVADHERGRV